MNIFGYKLSQRKLEETMLKGNVEWFFYIMFYLCIILGLFYKGFDDFGIVFAIFMLGFKVRPIDKGDFIGKQ